MLAFSYLFLIIIIFQLVLSGIIYIEWVILIALAICVYYLNQVLKSLPKKKKQLITTTIFPIISSIIFFAAFLQLFSSITIYVHHYVNTTIGHWKIPATWLSALEAISLLLIAPLFTKIYSLIPVKSITLSGYTKILIGLSATVLAFVLFSFSGHFTSDPNHMALFFIIVGCMLFAVGELCIIPTSIMLITHNSPRKSNTILIGFYYFSLSISGYISGIIAKIAPAKHFTACPFSGFFLGIAIAIFIVFLILLAIFLYIKKHVDFIALEQASD